MSRELYSFTSSANFFTLIIVLIIFFTLIMILLEIDKLYIIIFMTLIKINKRIRPRTLERQSSTLKAVLRCNQSTIYRLMNCASIIIIKDTTLGKPLRTLHDLALTSSTQTEYVWWCKKNHQAHHTIFVQCQIY